jgi:phosphatidylethanolamine/phosphatidyl-N-methylethanolamine N-methyltransferase
MDNSHFKFHCPLCASSLQEMTDGTAACPNCRQKYSKNEFDVWDLRQSHISNSTIAIFKEPKYQHWLKVFGDIEMNSWKIYENAIYRFFTQAGHRLIGSELIRKGLNAGQVLEIGGGGGELLNHVIFDEYTVVDTNLGALNRLKTHFPPSNVICTSGGKLPFDDSTFDVVVSLHVLEHVYQIAELLEEIIRVLKPTGSHYFVIPTEGGLAFRLGRALVTGPHLKKTYGLDVNYVMDREHINDAPRVLKFLRLYFPQLQYNFWPNSFFRILSVNAMIWGHCGNPKHSLGTVKYIESANNKIHDK